VDGLKASLAETSRVAGADLSAATSQAKSEAAERGKKAGAGVGMLGAATAVALLSLGALTAFFVLALDGVMPNWAAALVVAGAYAAAAVLLFSVGKGMVARGWPLVSDRTKDSFREAVGGAVTGGRESLTALWPPVSPATVDAVRADLDAVVTRGKEGVQEAWPPVPEQTVETLKEDLKWAKNQT